jgi:hypothetical protein
MKTIPSRWGWCVLLAVSALMVRAGAPEPVPAPPPTTTLPVSPGSPVAPQRSSPSISLSLPALPDGFDISSGDPEKIAEQTMAIQAAQRAAPAPPAWEVEQEQEAAANDRDWMLRDYTARLQKAGLAPATPAPSDPGTLPQPSDTPNDASETPTDPLTKPLDTPKTPSAASTTESEMKPELSASSLGSLQPLLPPLDPPAAKAPTDPWGAPPSSQDFIATPDLTPTPALTGENAGSSSSLDVPGLTAVESGMGPAPGSVGFQDALPDEPAGGSRKIDDQNNFLVPIAPTSDVTEFFKKQAEGLRAPNAPTVMEAPTVVARPIAPVAPEQIAKPAISGLRSHVDDPFDILRQ